MRIYPSFLLPAVGAFLVGVGILIYTEISGPGWQFVRFYLGDVVAVAFLYFGLSFFWCGPMLVRGAIIGMVAVSIEFAQLFGLTPKSGHWIAEIALGSHFEIWDLVAYGVGLTVAMAIEWQMLKHKA
jgi:Protein of unknown function (DUF2809)